MVFKIRSNGYTLSNIQRQTGTKEELAGIGEERDRKYQLKSEPLLPQTVKRNQEETEETENLEEDVVDHVGSLSISGRPPKKSCHSGLEL